MGIIKSILTNHFEYKVLRKWVKTFWFVDIHNTIVKANYEYGNIPKDFFPLAKETLQMISKLPDICLVMYTCSHPNEIEEYIKFFNENDILFEYVNENPEVKTDKNGYGCYDKKPYFNVLLDDKCGFDPDEDWAKIYSLLIKNYGKNS